jgi:hypothetical protein
MIAVQVAHGEVEMILIRLLPHGHASALPPIRTAKGVTLRAPLRRLRSIYGDPDFETDRFWGYSLRGIGFLRYGELVAAFLIFKPGTRPNLAGGVR